MFFPPLDENEGTEGPLIIEAEIGGYCIHRMYVNDGSASKILYEYCFNQLRPEIKNQLVTATTPLIGFSGEIIWPIGQIQLLVRIGNEKHSVSAWINFVVVRSPSPYNRIIGRPGVRKLQAVPSTTYKMLKITVEEERDALRLDKGKKGKQRIEIKNTGRSWKACEGRNNEGNSLYAEATYQRLVDKAFHKQIGRNLEVYVDDLVIKSRTKDEIVRDIEETFKRKINMKLNPKKCTFRVEEGMFLGYKVNTKGLKVCPDKVDAVLSLSSSKCLKDVQKLNGKLASLNRFVVKSAEKSLPFFKTLKKCTKKSDFHWTAEAEEAFKQMKQLIAELPMLTAPMEKEELIVYLEATKETVSAVLMTERETKQMPIYFASRALRGPELNYTSMEKLVLALVHASKHLKRYFQAHPIIVITDQPIHQVLSRPKVVGRQQKWSIELGEYAIHYRPRVSVKRQILADFIVERPEEGSLDTLMEVEEEIPELWFLFTDGSSCTDVLVEELKEKSIREVEILAIVEEEGDTWMTPIFKYLEEGTLPADVKKARATTSQSGLKQNRSQPSLATRLKNLCGTTSSADSDSPERLSRTMENSFGTIHSRVGVKKLCIRQHFASVKHLQTNDLVKRANRSLEEGIKARLDARSKNWMEELPHVLWAHRTMIKSSNGDTPNEGGHPGRD
nr:reverse transcriptase domain-containing protein [Tanacetum cinerariifolium]